MVGVKQRFVVRRSNQSFQFSLSSQQWQRPQVFSVQPEQIERVEHRLGFPIQEFVENTSSSRIDADKFSVQNCILHAKFAHCRSQVIETLVDKIPARDQLAAPIIDIGQRTESIVLQFE